jgi:hypothetical protein
MAQNAEGARGIAEALGDLLGGEPFEEIGPQGLVLALGGGSRFEEEAGLLCYSVW